jgi:glyoxylase-like metal-dependent hydrolase (beta-lactamase superfamily II)
MRRVTDNLYIAGFFGEYLNIYFYETPDGLAMIDAGLNRGNIDALTKRLATINRTWADVKHILITHAHPDHIGGLAYAQTLTPARTYAHRVEAAIIRGERKIALAAPETLGAINRLVRRYGVPSQVKDIARVDHELADGDSLDQVAPGLKGVELAGHAYGQVGFWWPDQRLLIGGDVMSRLPFGLTLPLRAATPDWAMAKAAVRRVAEMNVETLCLGHGRPIVTGAADKIRAFAAKL